MLVGEWLGGFIQADPKIINIVAFAIIVMVVILLLTLIGKLITKTLKLAMLGGLNRVLGVVFSLLKAALMIGLLIFLLDPVIEKFQLVNPEVLENSVIYTALHDLSLKVFPYLKDLLVNA